MQPTLKPWLSLWVTIHFIILALGLLSNNGGSQLMTRMGRIVSPYAVALHQDYGNLPLAMTTGEELDQQCRLEVRLQGEAPEQWQAVTIGTGSSLEFVDQRAINFGHMLSIAGQDKNEEVLTLIFDQVAQQYAQSELPIDAIRLRRIAAYDYDQAILESAGELPPGTVDDRTIFECSIIQMPGGAHRLLPVLDKVRRAQVAGAGN